MIIVEFSIIPIGVGTGLSGYVAEAVKVLDKRKVKYQLTAMGTIFEAKDLKEAFEIIMEAHEAVIKAGAMRVITNIKLDDRRDKEESMERKVKAVMEKLR
ncbi:MAG: MTH1187 family thiamine-binding protein [archaeon YNP-LCB-024-027]|jgi:uncharacterized protein (TIGR00106 family)|nr:MTH1187 family thiamine-binding protein [Candidatus Culexarchaeum yellowstonense]